MLIVGTQADTSRRAVEMAERYEDAWASVGLHPIHLEEGYYDLHEESPVNEEEKRTKFRRRAEVYDREFYRQLAKSSSKVVAIGETGLDYYRLAGDEAQRDTVKAKQRAVFREQANLAAELDLALVVHCREAHREVYEILQAVRAEKPHLRGVIHCFTGTPAEAARHLSLGFFISFSGIITFARDWDEFIRATPLEKLLIETDCPYLTPVPHRGRRNEPLYVQYTAQHLAALKGCRLEEVAEATTANAAALFRLPAA